MNGDFKMKKYFLAILVGSLFFSEAFASGFIACDLEATVKQVQALGVLNETVSRSHITKVDSYRYIATLDITSSHKTGGNGECMMGEHLIELKQGTQVNVGDTLKIEFIFAHDRPGSSTTYRVK